MGLEKGGAIMTDNLISRPKISKKAGIISMIMLLIVGVLSNYIYALNIYVEPLHNAHGWSMNTIVLAYSTAMFCEVPAYVVGGWLSSRFGMKKILVISGVLYGLAILVSGLTSSVAVFIFSQGIVASLAMFGIFIATLALINVLYPGKKGLVMGLFYGSQALGGAAMAPMAHFFIEKLDVSMALVWQGAIFAVVMFICCMLVTDPTKGDAKTMSKLQEEAEKEEAEAALEGKSEEARPTMRWKKVFTYPAFWIFFVSLILIQMIGNVLVTDISYLAKTNYGASGADGAWVASAFAIGAGAGGVVIGYISDKIGPYKTTCYLGIIDGILLLILILIGTDNFMFFGVMCAIQGFTYNGMTTLNPVMLTDSYAAEDLGITMGCMAIAYTVVGVAGPQLGLVVAFVPMVVICAVFSIIGGLLSKMSCKSLNKYYRSIGSKCQVR